MDADFANAHREYIERAFEQRDELDSKTMEREYGVVIRSVISLLTHGGIRVAEKIDNEWVVHDWVRYAILLYFKITPNSQVILQSMAGDDMVPRWQDKVPLRQDFGAIGVRAVPGSIVRVGTFLEKGVVLMPSLVNIGAYVGAGTMVDTWATVGSCAQIGRNVHLAGGVGIGGVLEPPGARPVIVEDDAFIGSRCIVVEGALIGEGAALGAGVMVTGSTAIIDAETGERLPDGIIPPWKIVIPGMREREFGGGKFHIPCALVVRDRPRNKLETNQILRELGVAS